MKPLRVLSVISSSTIGGAERVLATILKLIDRRRVEMSVVCPGDGPMVGEFRRHAAAVWTMDLGRVLDPRAVRRLAAVMGEAGAEVVHTRLWNADALGALAARWARVPVLISSVHGGYHPPTGAAGVVRLRRALLSLGFRAIYRCFDRVLVGSRFTLDDLVGRPGIRVDRRVIEILPIGPDLDRVDPYVEAGREFPSPRRAEPRIVVVANLIPMKGHEWLLRAMPQVLAGNPAVRCLLVGDGPLRRGLEALTARLGLTERVTFAGEIADPLELVRESDVLVLPSVAAEGVSIAILEALSLGTPVVGTSVGGIPHALDDGRVGLLVPPGDPVALATAILEVLGDPALARRLSHAGQEYVRTRYSARAWTARLETLYWDLARSKGIRRPEER